MGDKGFLDYLGHYMKGDDLDRFKKMYEASSEVEFLEYEHQRILIRDKPQVLKSCSFVRNESSEEHILGGVIVFNDGDEKLSYHVDILIQNSIPLTFERSIDAKSSKEEWFDTDLDSIVDLMDEPVKCDISVRDSYGRELSSSSGYIRPSNKSDDVSGKIAQSSKGEDSIGTCTIKSEGKFESYCVLKVVDDEILVYADVFRVPPKSETKHKIRYNNERMKSRTANLDFFLEFDGIRIASPQSKMSVSKEDSTENKVRVDTTLLAECSGQRIVDLSDLSDGNVVIGAVAIRNEGDQQRFVTVESLLNGRSILTMNVRISVKSAEMVPIHVPLSSISFDDTRVVDVQFLVTSQEGHRILDRTLSMTVRSRFDLDLLKVKEQTARLVNPLCPDIKSFVDNADGPLAKAMGRNFSVTGYQLKNAIVPQIKCVFDAVKSLRLHYVSDTSTLKDEGHYQRVRTPKKVLNDRSGNCIELSILFASILESMGLEPVVVFPVGHAIVGVVLSTDMYRTDSCMPPVSEDVIIKLRDGNKTCEVLCFESTCCTHSQCSFEDSVRIATKTINSQLSNINRRKNFSLIVKERQSGIRPKVV